MNGDPTGRARPKRLVSLGACTVDIVLKVDGVPSFDAKVMAEKGVALGAGMAVSAACAAAAMGAEVQVWGRMGADRIGDFFVADLADAGVDTRFVRRPPGSRSSIAAVIVDGAGRRLVAPWFDPALDADPGWLPLGELDRMDGVLADSRWAEGSRRVLEAARARGLVRVFDGDVASRETLAELAPLATHAIFSEPGFGILTGGAEPGRALPELARRHGGVWGVTLGERGFAWSGGGPARLLAPPPVEAVDTLAAGDVFHGAFAVAIVEGRSVAAAARLACAAAALKCARFGGRAGAPTRAEAEALARETYGPGDAPDSAL